MLPSHTMTGYCIACNKNTKTRFRSNTQFSDTYSASLSQGGLVVIYRASHHYDPGFNSGLSQHVG